MRRLLLFLSLAALLALVAVLYWPTPYIYVNLGPNRALARVNRLTGSVQVWNGASWIPAP